MKRLILLLVVLLAIPAAAQTTYSTRDDVLSVILPADWVAVEDAYQVFITNRAGITANTVEAGDIAISITRPALLQAFAGVASDDPAEIAQALLPLAEQEGENIGEVQVGTAGAFLTASFSYTLLQTGNEAQFVVVQAGQSAVALQIVTPPGEMQLYEDEIELVMLSLRVGDRVVPAASGIYIMPRSIKESALPQ